MDSDHFGYFIPFLLALVLTQDAMLFPYKLGSSKTIVLGQETLEDSQKPLQFTISGGEGYWHLETSY